MSVCDTCRIPGRCCTGLIIAGGDFGRGLSALELLIKLASIAHGTDDCGYPISDPRDTDDDIQLGLPFMPLGRRVDGSWMLWCPLLTREGRCGDYENRPALCRAYLPKTDNLCAEYEGVPYQTEWEDYNAEQEELGQ